MTNILITAFEPYAEWTENASWLALIELTKQLPVEPRVTTRLYPVDFAAVQHQIENDLADDYDVALHLGQAPGSASVRLESVAINLGGPMADCDESVGPLAGDGPVAYQSSLPLPRWSQMLREQGIPAEVSFHAGTYLCNAAFYFSQHFSHQKRLKTQSTFIHLPLDVSQASGVAADIACLPASISARAIRAILEAVVAPTGIAS